MRDSSALKGQHQALLESYLTQLPNALNNIDNHWSMLNNINWSFDRLEQMQISVHKLAGSAGGYGLDSLSEEAKALDSIIFEYLKVKQIPDFSSKKIVGNCIERMFEAAGITPSVKETVDKGSNGFHAGKQILIIDDDKEQSQLIELLCAQLECTSTCLTNLPAAFKHIKDHTPDLILMDVVFPEGQFAGIDAVSQLRKQLNFDIPIIFMSSRGDLSSRLKSYRAGGSGYLTKPFDITKLKVQLDILHNHLNHHAKVLILDEKEQTNNELSPFLKKQGFDCSHSNNPATILHMLERHTPDILVLDTDTSTIDCDEILQVLRQETRYMNLPILVITEDDNIADQAVAHGASGVIHKPIDVKFFLESIQTLVTKTSTLNSFIEKINSTQPEAVDTPRQSFYPMVEHCINSEDDHKLLVCVGFKNRNQIAKLVGLTHIDDLNTLLINKISTHLSGEEKITTNSDFNYALLISEMNEQSIESRLEAIKLDIESFPILLNKNQIKLEYYCGAIHLNDNKKTVDDVFTRCQNALLDAMEDGVEINILHNAEDRNNVTREEARLAVEYALSESTLFLTYQPIIDVNGDEKIFEGFARIKDCNDHTLMPNSFMPEVIETTQKEALNRRIVEAAIKDILNLNGHIAEEVEVVVKLMILDKAPTIFLTWVSSLLREARIRGKNRLIFSVSEEEALLYPDRLKVIHGGISVLDCGFLLDHAGSSANTQDTQNLIAETHFEYIKLSLNTIQGVKNGDDAAIEFAQSLLTLNTCVIAPFIEDNSTFAALWKVGVRNFQGYYVKKPEPSLAFEFTMDDLKPST